MFTQPGTKLLFMGNEFAQNGEWNFTRSLDWHLLQYESHAGMQRTVKALNKLYRSEPALYVNSFSYEGFEWINADDAQHSVYIYVRRSNNDKDTLIVILNLTPVYREGYRIGLPSGTKWQEIFNTDSADLFGSGKVNNAPYLPTKESCYGRELSILMDIPPLAAVVLKQVK